MKFKTVSKWWVIDEIEKGKKLYCLDRKLRKIVSVNDSTVQDVVRVTKSEEDDRYEFWYEEDEAEESAEVENG